MAKINGGYYIKARKVQYGWIAHAAPVVREVWDYLLREANHMDTVYNGYTIKRGQLFRSYREIRDGLKWSVGFRSERYSEAQMKHTMKLLRRELMIDLTSKPRGNIITILNYNKYQNPKNYESTNEHPNESTNDIPSIDQQQLPINKNDNINPDSDESGKQEFYMTKKKRKLTGKRLETFNLFWNAFAFRKGKADAADSWHDIPQLTESLVSTICEAAKIEAINRVKILESGSTPKWAQGWLTSRRWEDEDLVVGEKPKEKIYVI